MVWQFSKPEMVHSGILDALLTVRGYKSDELFRLPEAANLFPPEVLYDTQTAAQVIATAIRAGKKIGIHGDYDVDGVSATAILWKFLYRYAKADAIPFIPSRFEEGYGLTVGSVDQLVEQGVELIITVDCGIKDADLIAQYADKGINFVITDHHSFAQSENGETTLPQAALAVVHPRYPDHEYPQPEVCGTLVAWKLVQVLAKELEIDYDLLEDVDLVALATNCDLMSLLGENRLVTQLGLQKLRHNPNLGLAKLYQIAGLDHTQAATYHLGFVLGPRLNAAGRLESAMTALRLLCTTNPAQAMQLARTLDDLNKQRQDLTQEFINTAEQQIAEQVDQHLYFVHGDEWPEGVLGLIAGKLTEKYHRPVLAASLKDGQLVGSARSIEALHITNLLGEFTHLLERYGGHAQAAGFTVKAENLPELITLLQQAAKTQLNEEQLEQVLKLDLALAAQAVNMHEVQQLGQLEPHGLGNPKPVFGLTGLEIVNSRQFGRNQEHIAWRAQELPDVELVLFGRASEVLTQNVGPKVDIAVQLGVQTWQQRQTVQGIVKDIKTAE